MPDELLTRDSDERAELLSRAVNEFEVRAEGDDWIVEGIAVPWDQTIEVAGVKERFERGAFADFTGGAPFYGEHGHLRGAMPVGTIIASEARDAGQWFRALISKTDAGREVYTLMRDRVLRALSVGFKPLAVRVVDGVNVYTRAKFGEVSATAFPAYAGATILAVRSDDEPNSRKETGMTPEEVRAAIAAATAELQTRSDEFARQLAVLADGVGAGGEDGASRVASKFRSLGHYVKALAAPGGVDQADALALTEAYADAMETRAYTGATTADLGTTLKAAWIDRDVKMITERRRIFEQFSSERLPSTGMSVEYPKFGSKTGEVAEQLVEGDDLTYLELIITTATAAVKTYGGWSQLTRQVIERSSVAYLNKVLAMQKASYAKTTNGAIRTILTALAGTNTDTLPFADRLKAGAWTDRVLKSASDFETNSTTGEPDLWIMGLTHFQQMANVIDTTNRPVFVINGGGGSGVNTIGGLDLRKLTGNVAGLPVFLDPGLTGTFSYICSREALTTLESGPFSLADENVVNLSKAFSLYGYLSVTANDPKGVTKVNHPIA